MAAPIVPAWRIWKSRKRVKQAVKWAKRGGKWVIRRRTTKEIRDKARHEKKVTQSHKYRESKRGLGSAVKRTGRPKSRKTMRARSAPKPKMVRYRKGGCPPGYRYDPRRKMCIQINYK
jgi:hypothetical protein